jgi:hypothetical protein
MTQGIEGRLIGNTFHLNPIGFFQLMLWIGDARLCRAVIGQDHQAFAVAVQPTCGIKAGRVDVRSQGRMFCTICGRC